MYKATGYDGPVTRHTINTQGKIVEKKVYLDWYQIQKERHPEYF